MFYYNQKLLNMIQLLSGIIASAVHVISGPDHLAAVTPLAIESKKKAWNIGIFWGLGHVIGMLLIGFLFYLFRDFIPVEKISGYSELIVGLVLILIGLWAIYKVFGKIKKTHKHPHFHEKPEPYVHIHTHEHKHEFEHNKHTHQKLQRQNNITALGIGTLHGFAGISHFLLVLPTLTFPNKVDSVMYLSGFGIGTIAAMALYALLLGVISKKSSEQKNQQIFKWLRIGGGLVAIVVGVFWTINAW